MVLSWRVQLRKRLPWAGHHLIKIKSAIEDVDRFSSASSCFISELWQVMKISHRLKQVLRRSSVTGSKKIRLMMLHQKKILRNLRMIKMKTKTHPCCPSNVRIVSLRAMLLKGHQRTQTKWKFRNQDRSIALLTRSSERVRAPSLKLTHRAISIGRRETS